MVYLSTVISPVRVVVYGRRKNRWMGQGLTPHMMISRIRMRVCQPLVLKITADFSFSFIGK
jgi:hypothetical protein